MRKSVSDILAGLGFLAGGAVFGLQLGELDGISRVFPQALIIIILVGGLYFVGKGLMLFKREKAEEVAAEDSVNWTRVTLISVLALSYALVISFIGFFVTTASFLFAAVMLLGERDRPLLAQLMQAVLVAFIFCLFIWLSFVKLLNVPTPAGILF